MRNRYHISRDNKKVSKRNVLPGLCVGTIVFVRATGGEVEIFAIRVKLQNTSQADNGEVEIFGHA